MSQSATIYIDCIVQNQKDEEEVKKQQQLCDCELNL